MKKKRDIQYNYYPLKGFIYSNKELKNLNGLAQFLEITSASLNDKIDNISMFSQDMIYKIMIKFNLTPQQVVDYFFTKENKDD